MPRKKWMTMELRKIEGVGLFSDGPKRTGRPKWKRWPFRPSMLYNTVAGGIAGYRMMNNSEYDGEDIKNVWMGIEEAELITGVPREVLRPRWWAATEGYRPAWPWSTVSCEDDKPYTRLHALIFWSQWVWSKHVREYFGVSSGAFNDWVEAGPIATAENPFRMRAGTKYQLYYLPDVLEMAMRSKVWKLMRGASTLDDVDTLTYLSPRAIADLKLGGRWGSSVRAKHADSNNLP